VGCSTCLAMDSVVSRRGDGSDLEESAGPPRGRLDAAQGLLVGALLGGVSWLMLWLVGSTFVRLLP